MKYPVDIEAGNAFVERLKEKADSLVNDFLFSYK